MPTPTCQSDCTIPPPAPRCQCQASANYDPITGRIDVDFDLCGAEVNTRDWIGIYPCDAPTIRLDQQWWTDVVCKQFRESCTTPFGPEYGYIEGQTYVNQEAEWFAYTCGDPLDGGCQTDRTLLWPEQGRVSIDPNVSGARWAFPGGRSLEPGCYKVLMNRYNYIISPPPYATLCASWDEALTFTVP